jgi:hypothetical protein
MSWGSSDLFDSSIECCLNNSSLYGSGWEFNFRDANHTIKETLFYFPMYMQIKGTITQNAYDESKLVYEVSHNDKYTCLDLGTYKQQSTFFSVNEYIRILKVAGWKESHNLSQILK